MPDRTDVIYKYDGSFNGLMCCVYESFYRREKPFGIFDDTEIRNTLFETKYVVTDPEKASKVMRAITDKISGAAMTFIFHAYLSCLPDKELRILEFLYLGFKRGNQVMKMLTDETVHVLDAAVRHLDGEVSLLRGFVRFSDFGGGLVATIEPKNNVLPLLKFHFLSRYPDGCFMIYDKTHSLLLVAKNGKSRIVPVEDFTPSCAEADEIRYRALWKKFYDTIAVEGRENPKCRMSHMPKRYWAHMTEMKTERKSGINEDNDHLIAENRHLICD